MHNSQKSSPETLLQPLPQHQNKQLLILLVLLLPGLIIRLAHSMHEVDVLTLKFLPDDTFYYFTVARNIASGWGSTFDRLAPTNGYHPLWMMLITPLFYCFSGLNAPVSASLALGSVLSTISAGFVFLILKRLNVSLFTCFFGALVYYYSHFTFQFSLNGLETALCAAAVAFGFWLYLCKTVFAGLGRAFGFGAAMGLAVLARTDLALLFFPIGVEVALRLLHRRMFKHLALLILGFTLVTGPWFLWCQVNFGGVIQVSGKALPYYAHANFAAENPGAGMLDEAYLNEVRRLGFRGLVDWGIYSGFSPVEWEKWNGAWRLLWGFYILFFGWLLGSLCFSREKAFFKRAAPLWPVFVFLPAYFMAHYLVRWSPREWYCAIPGLFAFIMLALFLDSLFARLKNPYKGALLVFLTVIISAAYLYQFKKMAKDGLYRHQFSFIRGAEFTRETARSDERLGFTDAGYYGYMLHEYQVVNLDGLVNNHAYEAARNGRLAEYILNVEIDKCQIRPYLTKDHFLGHNWRNELEHYGGWLEKRRDKVFDSDNIFFHMQCRDLQKAKQVLPGNWTPNAGEAWSDGEKASLHIPMEQDWGDLALGISCKGFELGPYRNQAFTWSINGVQQPGTMAVKAFWSKVELHIPAGCVKTGNNIIELQFKYAIAPRDVSPDYQDSRKLGINIRELAVWPMEKNRVE